MFKNNFQQILIQFLPVYPKKSFTGRFAILFVILLAFNCGVNQSQIRSISRFSSAAKSSATIAEQELLIMRNETIKMNETRIQLMGVKEGEPGYGELDENFKAENLSVRITALQTLYSYANLLERVSNENSFEAIEGALDSFMDNADNLTPQNSKMDQNQKSGILKSVQILGRSYTDKKKKEVLKEVISNAKPQVDLLCDLLIADFDYEKNQKLGFQFQLTTERLLIAADEAYEQMADTPNRPKALRGLKIAFENRERKTVVVSKISQSFRELKKANSDLATAFGNETYEKADVKDFIKTVNQLQESQKMFRGGKK